MARTFGASPTVIILMLLFAVVLQVVLTVLFLFAFVRQVVLIVFVATHHTQLPLFPLITTCTLSSDIQLLV